MASQRDRWVLGLALGQLALLGLTFPIDVLGTEAWHHLASLAGVLLLAWVIREPLTRSRGFLALGVLATSVLAAVSGFYLLYWKAGIRVDGYQDWGVFWHVAWSWMAALFAVQHTWINRAQLAHMIRRSLATRWRQILHVGGYVLVAVAFAVTWSKTGRAWFTNEAYIPLTLRTWVLATVPPYLAFLAFRARHGEATGSRWARALEHWRVRTVVDLALVPLTVLTVVSGLPLFLLGDQLDAGGWKYVSKYWHVWPSILFTVLVFIHGVQAWRAVQAHWRNWRMA